MSTAQSASPVGTDAADRECEVAERMKNAFVERRTRFARFACAKSIEK